MTPSEPSTVWILGAGFSRSLGAPLFKDLFRSAHLVKAACGGSPPEGMIGVLNHYLRHAPEALGGTSREHGLFWQDPEEFLDVIESAMAGYAPAVNILSTDTGNVATEMLVNMGRRALAIECSHFLREANFEAERWLPYLMWGSGLTDNDTIVTFNYDRIPELLGKSDHRFFNRPKLKVVVPADDVRHTVSHIRKMSGAPVLKLHGSVNWLARRDHVIEAHDPPKDDLAVTCENGSDLILGVPGPGKLGLRDKYKPMKALWAVAGEEIKKASRIVFVGYRFPQTDASARVEILDSIKEAVDEKKLERVQVVLGPNENAPDVARMKKLLGFVCPGIVEVLPLYAEDFLAMPREWTAAPAAVPR